MPGDDIPPDPTLGPDFQEFLRDQHPFDPAADNDPARGYLSLDHGRFGHDDLVGPDLPAHGAVETKDPRRGKLPLELRLGPKEGFQLFLVPAEHHIFTAR